MMWECPFGIFRLLGCPDGETGALVRRPHYCTGTSRSRIHLETHRDHARGRIQFCGSTAGYDTCQQHPAAAPLHELMKLTPPPRCTQWAQLALQCRREFYIAGLQGSYRALLLVRQHANDCGQSFTCKRRRCGDLRRRPLARVHRDHRTPAIAQGWAGSVCEERLRRSVRTPAIEHRPSNTGHRTPAIWNLASTSACSRGM